MELAQRVREATRYAAEYPITIAVMGCRVNGPGETDHADLGLWCGPNFVNLKRGGTSLGAFSYEEVIPRLKAELDALIAARTSKWSTVIAACYARACRATVGSTGWQARPLSLGMAQRYRTAR